jgi:hypothetical protein
MSFKKSETTVGSAVATSGTITLSYPTGTSAGTFAAHGHKLWVDKFQRLLTSPSDFTVTFGASDITVTYLGATTIPAGARVNAQLNIEGSDTGELPTDLDESQVKRTILNSLTEVNIGSPAAADANGYVESQDLTSAGVFSVSGTAAAAIAAAALAGSADVPRNVVASWTGTAVLTVTGEDEYGNVMVESSGSGTSLTGKKAFAKVTNISSSADITSLTVGTGNVLGLPFFVSNAGEVIAEFEDGSLLIRNNGKVYLTGTMLEAAVDAGTGKNIVSPVAGNISKLTTISAGTITTGGAITVEVNTTAVDGLSVTVADSSSEGDVDSDTPTAGHATTAVAVGDRIEIIPASAFNASADLYFVLEIDLDGGEQLNGTLVAGVSAAATATTGDVRGTYTPTTTPDGSTSFDLLVASADPKYLGVSQYAG